MLSLHAYIYIYIYIHTHIYIVVTVIITIMIIIMGRFLIEIPGKTGPSVQWGLGRHTEDLGDLGGRYLNVHT